jgi:hypothetical protein
MCRDQIPVCIQSCSKEFAFERRMACLDTWVPTLSSKFYPIFLVGNPDQEVDYIFKELGPGCGNYLSVRFCDEWYALSGKMRRWWVWALEHFDAPWFFKCDDDSYVNGRLFNDFPFERYDYTGHFYTETYAWKQKRPLVGSEIQYKAHGAGYSLSRRCAKLVSEKLGDWEPGGEDVSTARTIFNGIPDVVIHDMWEPRVAPWARLNMQPDWLVGHEIRGMDMMRQVHRKVVNP